MKKTVFHCILCIVLVLTAFLLISEKNEVPAQAQADTFVIQSAKTKVKKDKTFTVKITIHSNEPMQNVQASLSYDATLAEYISDDQPAIVGTSGLLTLNDTFEKGITDKTYKLKFQALQLGNCQFLLDNANYTRFQDLSVVSKGSSAEEIEIIVNDGVEDDCTLEELFTAVGEWQEDWDSETYDYHITVPKETTVFAYSATPSCEDSQVVSEGPDTLSTGTNIYKITVTAPSGDSAVYTLKVVR